MHTRVVPILSILSIFLSSMDQPALNSIHPWRLEQSNIARSWWPAGIQDDTVVAASARIRAGRARETRNRSTFGCGNFIPLFF
jgi:hypothetical protein